MFIRSGYSAHTRSSGMEDHHLAADVVRRLAHPASLHAGESGGPALALEAPCGEPIEANQVAFDGSLARHRDRLAQALEHEAVGIGADRDRSARVHDAVEF